MMSPSSDPQQISTRLNERLGELTEKHSVPGAAAGILIDDQILSSAAGVLNLNTGVSASEDSLFQIGSITKVWTATLIMQLADEETLDLDAPVRDYLPEFTISDDAAAAAVTTRDLLSHRAGFEGDNFTDTGRGDDCVEKYVASLAQTPQLFPPGEQFSYNNAGYVVLGRLIEALGGAPFDQMLSQRLLQPLGLRHAAPSPYEAILHRVAVGHMPGPEGTPVVAPIWALPRSNSPAGSTLSMSVHDLLRFTQMHIHLGRGAEGQKVLSEEAARAMQQAESEVPSLGVLAEAWGLGWGIDRTEAGTMISHDGSTVGQSAFLRVLPELGVAVALLTNGGDAMGVYRELFDELLTELTEAPVLPRAFAPGGHHEPVSAEEAERFVGTYSASVLEMKVSRDEQGLLWIDETPKGVLAEMGQTPSRSAVVPHGSDGLITVEKQMGVHLRCAFLGDDGSGRAEFLHTGRAMPRALP